MAGKLTESWSLARECKKFLEENTEGWMRRTREETARVRVREEKLEMLEIPERLPHQRRKQQAER